MAEFDYEVVNGRKIRVRPVETVSEVDENIHCSLTRTCGHMQETCIRFRHSRTIHILKILQIRITRNREEHSSHSMQDS